MSDSKVPKSRKSHLFKMAAKMTFQQGKKLFAQPSERVELLKEQAEVLVKSVGQLKGAAMKAIQSLSIEGYDFLPPEVVEILEKLQSKAPPVPNEILLTRLENELGKEKFLKISQIHSEPLAAASIGQVYEATIDNSPVVIKIQYPDVAQSVDEDIDTLKKLLKTLIFVSQKKINLDEVMEEARRVLKLETDYKHEEASLIRYKKLFKSSSYIIPTVYSEFTTSKVLVMSKEEGIEFSSWMRLRPNAEQRDKVADQLLNLYIKEFFENRLVQTDPNPANFLINPVGDMVLLDFGATLEFDVSFVKDYQILVRNVFSKNRDKILEQVLNLRFIDPRESEQAQEAFLDFLILSLKPFEDDLQPFDFSNNDYSQMVRSEAWRFSRMLKYSAPPKNLIFLHRKLGGIFMLLKKLDVKKDLSPFKAMMIDTNYY